MSTRQRLNATCERCGRRIEVHQGRKKAVIVCFDCRYSDPEYLRLRTSNACGARGFAGVGALDYAYSATPPSGNSRASLPQLDPRLDEGN